MIFEFKLVICIICDVISSPPPATKGVGLKNPTPVFL